MLSRFISPRQQERRRSLSIENYSFSVSFRYNLWHMIIPLLVDPLQADALHQQILQWDRFSSAIIHRKAANGHSLYYGIQSQVVIQYCFV